MSLLLINAEKDSIWGRLYQNKMDENSHFPFQDGAKHIISEKKVAYLQNGEQLRYFDEFNCKVSFTYSYV